MLSPGSGAGWYPAGTVDPEPSEDSIADLFTAFGKKGIRLESVACELGSIYSPMITFGDMTEKFLDAHLSPLERFDKLRRFKNDWQAKEYKEVANETNRSEIMAHKCALPPQTVPKEAVALVCGIDCQKRGYYFTTWAFGRDRSAWLIHYGYLLSEQDLFNLVYNTAYPVEGSDSKRFMKIWRAGMDTGGGELDGEEDGSMTKRAYTWLAAHGGDTVYGVKGSSRATAEHMKANIIGKFPGSKEVIPGAGVKLWTLDTGYFKDVFFDQLQVKQSDPGCIYLHAGVGEDFASHLLSEEKKRQKNGSWAWEHVRGQNHYLDGTGYAWAMSDPMCLGGLLIFEAPSAVDVTPKKQQPAAAAGGGARPVRRRMW